MMDQIPMPVLMYIMPTDAVLLDGAELAMFRILNAVAVPVARPLTAAAARLTDPEEKRITANGLYPEGVENPKSFALIASVLLTSTVGTEYS